MVQRRNTSLAVDQLLESILLALQSMVVNNHLCFCLFLNVVEVSFVNSFLQQIFFYS